MVSSRADLGGGWRCGIGRAARSHGASAGRTRRRLSRRWGSTVVLQSRPAINLHMDMPTGSRRKLGSSTLSGGHATAAATPAVLLSAAPRPRLSGMTGSGQLHSAFKGCCARSCWRLAARLKCRPAAVGFGTGYEFWLKLPRSSCSAGWNPQHLHFRPSLATVHAGDGARFVAVLRRLAVLFLHGQIFIRASTLRTAQLTQSCRRPSHDS